MKWLDAWDQKITRLSEERFYLFLLGAMALLVTVVVGCLALGLHRNFLTIACDTAAYQNAIVNLSHGNGFRDTAYDGPNILGQHTVFIFLLIAPIYAIFPSPDTLFVLQFVGIYSAVIPLYYVAMETLGKSRMAFLIAASALVGPLLFNMAVSPFHAETWFLAAVFWSYLFYLRNYPIGYWVSAGFAVSCGEQVAFLYLSLGVALLLTDDGRAWRKKYGWWSLIVGFGWIAFATGLLFPLMHRDAQPNVIGYHYSNWNVSSASGLITGVMAQPGKALSLIFDPFRLLHVAGLVGFPLLLAFFSWRSAIFLASFPIYALMCDQEFYLYFHAYYYQFGFIAGYLGLLAFLGRSKISTRVEAVILSATYLLNILLLCGAVGFYGFLGIGRSDPFNATLHEVFGKIPPDAGVYSPHRFSAYLSNRENMVLGDLYDPNFDFKKMLDEIVNRTDVHPEQIDYIVTDLENDQCGPRFGGFDEAKTKQRAAFIDQLLKSQEWQVFWSQNNVVILKRIEK